jgi:two-component system OmpR family response regulator
MTLPLRILLAEDNEPLRRILERSLRAHGFEVASVVNPSDCLRLANDESIRLVVLDLASPNGIAHDVQVGHSNVPVLRLVAAGESVDAAEHTLSLTLRKPFALEELIARIHALTRAAGDQRVTTLIAGDVHVDLLARCAWRGDRVIELADREFALLEYFMRHMDRVLSRQQILTDVWGYNFDSSSNLIDVYVRYLRNKLDQPGEASLIASVRGAGYRFRVPSAAVSSGIKNSYRAGSA